MSSICFLYFLFDLLKELRHFKHTTVKLMFPVKLNSFKVGRISVVFFVKRMEGRQSVRRRVFCWRL